MKTGADQPVNGQVLHGRYRIVQILNAGAFGQIYIAEDTWQIGQPKCAIKHLIPKGNHAKRFSICKRLFISEAEALKKLGSHHQIPQLLDEFEDDQGFYLVQELIVGEPLTTELPSNQGDSKCWSEEQCVELLNNVLGILNFVHSRGFIHGDLKPNNLIRRTSDGKIVLLDFGAACLTNATLIQQQASQTQLTNALIAPLGYIPPEQLRGQLRPNSDLYALGMIAIQALTGLNPAHVALGEVTWQQEVSLSEPLACLLNRLIHPDFQGRYQSAKDVQKALKMLKLGGSQDASASQQAVFDALVVASPESVSTQTVNLTYYARQFALACWPKIPPFVAGVGAGIATSNAAAISLGLYSLLHAAPSNPGADLLARATEQYQAGKLENAIALAQSVPSESSAYQDSLRAVHKWRKDWNAANIQFRTVEQAFEEQRWYDVVDEASKLPNIAYWQQKVEPLVEQAKPYLEVEAQQYLEQAYTLAAQKDFTSALALLEQIHPETPTGTQIQPKLAEYRQKQDVKAQALLQKAYEQAAKRNFTGALNYLSQISQEASIYKTVQLKMAEYSQKQHIQEEVTRRVELAKAASDTPLRFSQPFVQSEPKKTSSRLNPGGRLQEVNLQSAPNR